MQIKTGNLTCVGEDGEAHAVTATLSYDDIAIKRLVETQASQETSGVGSPEDSFVKKEVVLDDKLRTVTIQRQAGGGLGISVKGGAEHGIPVLISKVFAGKPAHNTGKLFPGDVILSVDGSPTTGMKHDDVVDLLKSCVGNVTLTVRAFASTNNVLRPPQQGEAEDAKRLNGKSVPDEGHLSVSLQFARIQKKIISSYNGENKLAFQLIGSDGQKSGFLRCDTAEETITWLTDCSSAVHSKNTEFVSKCRADEEDGGINAVGWVEDRTDHTTPRPQFLVLHGDYIYFFSDCAFLSENWRVEDWKPTFKNLICETLFRYVTHEEEPAHCIFMQHNHDSPQCYVVETLDDLSRWNIAIRDFANKFVYRTRRKSYPCLWNGKECDLTIDFTDGFLLEDKREQSECWAYRFSRLKRSDDDGRCITFTFLNTFENKLEERKFSSDRAYQLLFCVHCFMAAKLILVDPQFFKDEMMVKSAEREMTQNLPPYNGIERAKS